MLVKSAPELFAFLQQEIYKEMFSWKGVNGGQELYSYKQSSTYLSKKIPLVLVDMLLRELLQEYIQYIFLYLYLAVIHIHFWKRNIPNMKKLLS